MFAIMMEKLTSRLFHIEEQLKHNGHLIKQKIQKRGKGREL